MRMVGWFLHRFFALALVAALLLLPYPGRVAGATEAALSGVITPASGGYTAESLQPPSGDGSVLFVENVGQFGRVARFQARLGRQTLWLVDDALWLSYSVSSDTDHPAGILNLKLSFADANPRPYLEPFNRLETRVHYYLGVDTGHPADTNHPSDPAGWYADVPVWGGVRYRDLYPGADLEIYGRNGQWAWRLVPQLIHPSPLGKNVGEGIPLWIEGAEQVIEKGHSLCLGTAQGELCLPALAAHATEVETGQPAVDVGPLDVTARAQGTPAGLLWSTFLGSGQSDRGNGIVVDGSGASYVTGVTFSPTFPTQPGLADTDRLDQMLEGNNDLFVAKLQADGSGLLYATLIGGSFNQAGYEDWFSEAAEAIAVDDGGSAYLTGFTRSTDFPTTAGAFDTTYNGGKTCAGSGAGALPCGDAFVTRLASDGQLAYSTFLGGSYLPNMDTGGDESGRGIAVDAEGQIYVTGFTSSWDFPTTAGAYKRVFARAEYGLNDDIFVTVLNPAGQGSADLVYSTFIGGGWEERGNDIAVDAAGAIYVTGYHNALVAYIQNRPDFATTAGAFDPGPLLQGIRAFVLKLRPGGRGPADLIYSTLFGAPSSSAIPSSTNGEAIALDGAGRVTISGRTFAADMVTTDGAYDRTLGGAWGDGFVAQFNLGRHGAADLLYATYLGGSGRDSFEESDVALDANGDVYVTGDTASADFPTTSGAFQSTLAGSEDLFVARLRLAGQGVQDLVYGTLFGGANGDVGTAIAVSEAGKVHVTGFTHSSDLPTTPGAFDTVWGGGADVVVFRLWAVSITTDEVDAFVQAPAQVYGLPMDVASIPIVFGNYGATAATSVALTATLHVSLTYRSDTLGLTPLVDGNRLVWTLPYTLPFPSEYRFGLVVSLPEAFIDTRLPITLTIGARDADGGTDALPANNQAVAKVHLIALAYLPVALRNHR